MSQFAERKVHALLTPFPIQGHINPVFKLAKLLHLRGFHINFVHTEYNHKHLLKSRGPNALNGLPDFRFETIPDGLPLIPPVTCLVSDGSMSFTIQAAEELGLPIVLLWSAKRTDLQIKLCACTFDQNGVQ